MASFSITGGSAVEGFGSLVRFDVTLSEPLLDAVTVSFRTLLRQTASEFDLRFESTSSRNNGVLTFAPGQITLPIFIDTESESFDELDEHFLVELFNPTGADFFNGEPVLRAIGVILDNDGTGPNLALFVSDPVLTEGDSGQKVAVFEVRLSQPALTSFAVSFTTADGTARAGTDYVATSGTLSFAAGQAVASVSVPVIGDAVAEAAEIFSLVVTPPANPSIGALGAVGEATILDTDGSPLPEISVASAATDEAFGLSLRFTVTLSEPSLNAISVNFRTLLSGTASEADLRFDSTSSRNNGVLTFAPGETSRDIFIEVESDNLDERDEHVTLELFGAAGAVFGGGTPVLRAQGVILDNDGTGPNLALFVSDPVLTEGNSGQTLAVFEVRLSQPAPSAFTANFTTADGTARAGTDYVATSGTLSFAAGQQVASVSVPVIGDTVAEAAEIFSLVVTPPANPSIGILGAVGEAKILDTDGSPLPEISVASAATDEAFSAFLRFTVTLSEPSLNSVSVNFRTLFSGTASEADLRFDSTSSRNNGVLTFAPGETSRDIFIEVGEDNADERDEHVTLELFGAAGAVFGGGTPVLRAQGFILDNDGTGPNLALFVSDPVLTEGNSGQTFAVFEVRLSQPAPAAFTANFTTADGTARAGTDYVATSGTLSFAAGQTIASVSVPVIGDTVAEAAEIFSLVVTPPANPSIGILGAAGEATILDTDGSPLPEIAVASAATDESSGAFLRFTVTLSEPSLNAVSVNFRTLLSGTASEADLRFDSTSSRNNGVLTFAPGETSRDIFIEVAEDNADERDEHVTLELFGAAGAVFGGGTPVLRAQGVILDNDGVGPNLALIVSDPVLTEGNSGQTLAVFEVRLSQPAPAAFTASFTTADGTARAGTDYVVTSGTLSFAAGQTVASVSVPVIGDAVAEAAEVFSLVVTPPANPSIGNLGAVGEATILDTDGSPLPEISVEGDTTAEGSSLRFVLTLSQASTTPVTVNFNTFLGTAENADLSTSSTSSSNNGTVTFAPGQTTASVLIGTRSDSTDERDETIYLRLTNPDGAVLGGGGSFLEATGFIADDDGAGQDLSLAAPFMEVREPRAANAEQVALVELSRPFGAALTFTVDAQNGTATRGADYELLTNEITFAPGQTVAGVRFRVTGQDAAAEGPETFTLGFTPTPTTPFTGTPERTTITILNEANQPPVARADSFVTAENAVFVGSLLTDNGAGADFDPDGGSVFVTRVNGAAVTFGQTIALASGAQLTLRNASGVFDYDPNGAFDALVAGQTGTDSFTYTISDAGGLTATAAASFTIQGVSPPPTNRAPDAVAGSATVAEDGVLNGRVRATDADGDALTFFLASGGAPARGALTIAPDGSFSYRPGANFNGADRFTFGVRDPSGATDTATFSITVPPTNDAPVAAAGSATVAEDGFLNGRVRATDADGDALTFFLAPGGAPARGSVRVNADGTFEYRPSGNFAGADRFTFSVRDPSGATSSASVALNVAAVNDAPTALPGEAAAVAGALARGQLRATDPENDPLTFALVGQASNGVATVSASGAFTYVADESFFGEDSFSFRVRDSSGAQSMSTVTFDVRAAPIIGTQGPDDLPGGAGDDSIAGRGGDDTLSGLAGADTLRGGSGNDTMIGGGGGDLLVGGGGADLALGGGGRDTIRGGGGDDELGGQGGSDLLLGGGGADLLTGSGGRDTLNGGGGNDTLDGGGGSDSLVGGGGDDRLIGGRGSDSLKGGGGNDVFVFGRGDGRDVIEDFQQGRDRIEIGTGAGGFGDLRIVQIDDDVLIRFSNVRITVEDQLAENFSATDFIF